MPHFFIDLRDTRGMVLDDEGAEFDHIEDAFDEAKASARELLKQYVDNHIPLDETCVEIRDVFGRTIAVLTVAEVIDHPINPAFKNHCSDAPKPGHH